MRHVKIASCITVFSIAFGCKPEIVTQQELLAEDELEQSAIEVVCGEGKLTPSAVKRKHQGSKGKYRASAQWCFDEGKTLAQRLMFVVDVSGSLKVIDGKNGAGGAGGSVPPTGNPSGLPVPINTPSWATFGTGAAIGAPDPKFNSCERMNAIKSVLKTTADRIGESVNDADIEVAIITFASADSYVGPQVVLPFSKLSELDLTNNFDRLNLKEITNGRGGAVLPLGSEVCFAGGGTDYLAALETTKNELRQRIADRQNLQTNEKPITTNIFFISDGVPVTQSGPQTEDQVAEAAAALRPTSLNGSGELSANLFAIFLKNDVGNAQVQQAANPESLLNKMTGSPANKVITDDIKSLAVKIGDVIPKPLSIVQARSYFNGQDLGPANILKDPKRPNSWLITTGDFLLQSKLVNESKEASNHEIIIEAKRSDNQNLSTKINLEFSEP